MHADSCGCGRNHVDASIALKDLDGDGLTSDLGYVDTPDRPDDLESCACERCRIAERFKLCGTLLMYERYCDQNA